LETTDELEEGGVCAMARYENRWREDEDRIGRWDEDDQWRRAGGRDDYRRGEDRGWYGGREDYGRSDYGWAERDMSWRDRGRDIYGDRRGPYRSGRDYGGYGERLGREDEGWRRYHGRDYGPGFRPRDRDYDTGYGAGGRDRDRGFMDRAGDEIASWFGDDEAERRRRMDAWRDEGAWHHRGRGPRNYTRSDDRIQDDVNDRLTDDSWIDASDIEVAVRNCEVTLSGTVDSRMAKRRAEDIADDISGVKHVQNNLRVHDRESVTATEATAVGTGATAAAKGAARRRT
jgi:osmotically-inducible protein OsmY